MYADFFDPPDDEAANTTIQRVKKRKKTSGLYIALNDSINI